MNKKERPVLENLVNVGTTEIEKFQNEVLRPIIKMQHNLLIASFNNYKNINLGFIIGHFSMDEFSFYSLNTSEMNRRILQIISQRIKDSISEIK